MSLWKSFISQNRLMAFNQEKLAPSQTDLIVLHNKVRMLVFPGFIVERGEGSRKVSCWASRKGEGWGCDNGSGTLAK